MLLGQNRTKRVWWLGIGCLYILSLSLYLSLSLSLSIRKKEKEEDDGGVVGGY